MRFETAKSAKIGIGHSTHSTTPSGVSMLQIDIVWPTWTIAWCGATTAGLLVLGLLVLGLLILVRLVLGWRWRAGPQCGTETGSARVPLVLRPSTGDATSVLRHERQGCNSGTQ